MNFKNLTIAKESGDKTRAKFQISPLPEGYGATLGNSLRRVLLSSLEGAAVFQAKIKGVTHEFTTIKGVKEDVVDFLLNLKQIRLKIEDNNPQVLTLKVSKEGEVKAGNIEVPAGVEIVNKDLHLATLDKGAELEVELLAQKGFGFAFSENVETTKVGVLALDVLYAPITRVSWSVEKTRVGRKSDLDKLVLDISTDGTITPKDALIEASAILRDFFGKIGGDAKAPMSEMEPEVVVKTTPLRTLEETRQDIDLENISAIPSRTVNALKKANINTVSDILERDWDELLAVKNMGKKSVAGLREILAKEGFAKEEK
ncbi:MAG: DNA-directed RNA polymerase subunit alpha [bacterium]